MDIEKAVQYLLDRREIEDRCILYATLVDTKQFDRLTEVFTPDAHIDYSATGGISGDFPTAKAFLEKSMPMFRSQHLMANIACEIAEDGMTAKTRVMFHNPMTMQREGADYTFYVGAWYNDEWVKTGEGWRMRSRVQEPSYCYRPKP